MAEYSSYMWSVPDWRSDDLYDVLDNRAKGVYRELIDQCWVAGSITSNPEALARFVGEPVEYFAEVWLKIKKKFRAIEGGERLVSKRLEEDRRRLENVRARRHERARNAAKTRWKTEPATTITPNGLHATSIQQAMLGDAQIQNQTNTEGKGSLLPDSSNLQKLVVPKRGERAGKTRAPLELPITESMHRWAEDNGLSHVNLKQETEAMLDHFRGTGEARLDWPATWRSWMRRVDKFAGKNGGHHGKPKESYAERVARRNREITLEVDQQLSGPAGDSSRNGSDERAAGALLPGITRRQ